MRRKRDFYKKYFVWAVAKTSSHIKRSSFKMTLQWVFCNSVLARRVQWGVAAVRNSCSWRRSSSALQPIRVKTNMQKKRVACLRATRNWVDLFEAVFPTAFKHIVPNLVGLSGAGSRCGPTWLSSTSKIRCCRASQRFNSLSIDVNVKNRRPWSRNMKDLEDSLKMCLYAWKRH